MFLLPPPIRQTLENLRRKDKQMFPLDAELVLSIRQTARDQMRSEEDVLAEYVTAGQAQIPRFEDARTKWDTLTRREQEVLALVCLGRRNYEISEILGITGHAYQSRQLRSEADNGFEEWENIAREIGCKANPKPGVGALLLPLPSCDCC